MSMETVQAFWTESCCSSDSLWTGGCCGGGGRSSRWRGQQRGTVVGRTKKHRPRTSSCATMDAMSFGKISEETQMTKQKRVCRVLDYTHQLVPYETAWRWQKEEVQRQLTMSLDRRKEDGTTDTEYSCAVLILQHHPVYTMGTGSTPAHLKFPEDSPPAPLHFTERGGEVTYHGPGQLVMYPILDLRMHCQDLHWYLRSLEEVVLLSLAGGWGVRGGRVPGLTGVWADGAKLAAIGVRVTKWVSYHGLALNVCPDLSAFDHIVPCGLTLPVGSVERHLAKQQLLTQHGDFPSQQLVSWPVQSRNQQGHLQRGHSLCQLEKGPAIEGAVSETLQLDSVSQEQLLSTASRHLLQALSEVFDLELTFVQEVLG